MRRPTQSSVSQKSMIDNLFVPHLGEKKTVQAAEACLAVASLHMMRKSLGSCFMAATNQASNSRAGNYIFRFPGDYILDQWFMFLELKIYMFGFRFGYDKRARCHRHLLDTRAYLFRKNQTEPRLEVHLENRVAEAVIYTTFLRITRFLYQGCRRSTRYLFCGNLQTSFGFRVAKGGILDVGWCSSWDLHLIVPDMGEATSKAKVRSSQKRRACIGIGGGFPPRRYVYFVQVSYVTDTSRHRWRDSSIHVQSTTMPALIEVDIYE